MTYVVTKPCLGTKDRSCVEVCPVDCFYDIRDNKYNQQFGISATKKIKLKDGSEADDNGMLMIHPDECINCGACETECPVEAIYEDTGVPDEMSAFVQINQEVTSALSDDQLDELRCTAKVGQ